MEKVDKDIESSSTRTKLSVETLAKKSRHLLRGSRVWISMQILPTLSFWLIWLIRFPLQGSKCIEYQASNFFTDWKMWFKTLLDVMQPVVLVNKKFDTQERSKTFALSSYFGQEHFGSKMFPRKYNWVLFSSYKFFEWSLDANFSASCFKENRGWLWKQIIRLCIFWHFPLFKICVPGNQLHQVTFPYIFRTFEKKTTDTLMNEMQSMVLSNLCLVSQKNFDQVHILPTSIHWVCNGRFFFSNTIFEGCFADRILDWNLYRRIWEGCFEKCECLSRRFSWICNLWQFLRYSFPIQENRAKMDSWVAFNK